MVKIESTYEGQLRCSSTHGPSQSTLITDAPVDNHGRGSAFSPTDLLATALLTCVMTTIAIVAERSEISVKGMRGSVGKSMTSAPPRRIAKLEIELHMPASLSEENRTRLEAAAKGCPVHRSLHPDVEEVIAFVYDV